MARLGSTGNIRVQVVPGAGPASMTAPSVATDLTGSVNVTGQLRRDGLTTPRSANTLDASDAGDRQNKTAPGNIDVGTLTLRFQRDSVTGSDTAWTTLAEGTAVAVYVRRFGGSTVVIAAADKVEVYVGSVISREMQPIGDEVQNFVATLSVEKSEQSATVAA